MKPRLFLDTNILLDVLLERPGYQPSLEILQAGSDGDLSLYTSILSMANIAYVLRKTLSPAILTPTLKQLSLLVSVLPMDEDQLREAILLSGPDFEDILQAVCAVKGNCEILITRNPKHFDIQSGLLPDWIPPRILAPEAFGNGQWDLAQK